MDTLTEKRLLTWHGILLVSILLFVAAIRFRLLDFPLERDEGEYAYMGNLILKGVMPYSEAYNMKFPGTYFAYAAIQILFGSSARGIHFGLLLVNLSCIWLIYKIMVRLVGQREYGVIAAAVFAIGSLSSTVLGFAAHATHFVILAALVGMQLLLVAHERRSWVWLALAGSAMGSSCMMKQSGAAFVLMGLSWLVVMHKRDGESLLLLRRCAVYSLAALVPFLLTVLLFHLTGTLGKFLFWTFDYASHYGSQVYLSMASKLFWLNFQYIWANHGFFWVLSVIGVIGLFFVKKGDQLAAMMATLALFSFLAVCPGFQFRQHYFVQYLPALGMTVASFLFAVNRVLGARPQKHIMQWLVFMLPLVGFFLAIRQEAEYLFTTPAEEMSRIVYKGNPFADSPMIGRYLKERTGEADRIAILGSEPQILVYANRRSATGYIYTYGLMEGHPYATAMQEEMIEEIEASDPKYLLFVDLQVSWWAKPGSDMRIFEWSRYYVEERYTIEGIVEAIGDRGRIVTENLQEYVPDPAGQIFIYRRKD